MMKFPREEYLQECQEQYFEIFNSTIFLGKGHTPIPSRDLCTQVICLTVQDVIGHWLKI